MGSSLGPLLPNIIMTELERTIIKKFIDDKILLFYGRYVDDTLVVIKEEHLQFVRNALNSFDKNLKFTVDLFDNVVPHFLDIGIHPDGLSIYCKDTNTGQYNTLILIAILLGDLKRCGFRALHIVLSRYAVIIN